MHLMTYYLGSQLFGLHALPALPLNVPQVGAIGAVPVLRSVPAVLINLRD